MIKNVSNLINYSFHFFMGLYILAWLVLYWGPGVYAQDSIRCFSSMKLVLTVLPNDAFGDYFLVNLSAFSTR